MTGQIEKQLITKGSEEKYQIVKSEQKSLTEADGHLFVLGAIFLACLATIDINNLLSNPHFFKNKILNGIILTTDGAAILASIYFMHESFVAYGVEKNINMDDFVLSGPNYSGDFRLLESDKV